MDVNERIKELQSSTIKQQFRDFRRLNRMVVDMEFNLSRKIIGLHSEWGDNPFDLWLGSYFECETPTGYCVYNVVRDPYKEHCLCCGKAYERNEV